MAFTHLHVHSHFSLLEAVPKPKELVAAAKADGMAALALTDAGALYGTIPFYQACRKEGIKPIIGLDAYLAPRSRFDKEAGLDKPRAKLLLLAKDHRGYQNLIKIVSASYTEGFYYRPRVDRQLLAEHCSGLITILPAFASEISEPLRAGLQDEALAALAWYRERFGEDVYLEITHHPEIAGHTERMAQVAALAREGGVPLVAAHEVYYLSPQDRRARKAMLAIKTGRELREEEDRDGAPEDFSFISQKTALRYFKDLPEAIRNTQKIAESCNLEIELGHWHFPAYVIASGRSAEEELRHHAREGLVHLRGLAYEGAVKERLEYELEVITTKGYAKYFLVVWDLLREARKRGILTTIRGSVAGSLTTYALGITTIDPLAYHIPFERFLNPHRPSAPDIDMDYADNRRDEMIEYAREKYGKDKVAQIGTFGTMMARAAVRDVARALGHPYALGDRIAKLIPFGSQGFPMSIEKAIELEKDLRDLYKKDVEVRDIIDLARQIEGRVRHIGVHAAGVVIAPEPLTNFVPLQFDPKGGKLITQYEMNSVGEDGVGLLKFDFLGIKNLSVLADALKRVEKIHAVVIDIEHIPLDDAETFAMLSRGETYGVFQLGGPAMTRYLVELKPTKITDINAMIALYRPGPMKNIPEYIARKQGLAPVTYFHPKARAWLEPSYGILVYQEDLLFTALELAGYTWESVDKFRKAVGKKIPEEMAKQHIIFVEGCMEHSGLSKEEAERIWDLFEPFQGYGFNKAHAASYGKVAYQTAYMKAHWPLEFMSAVLSADAGDLDKVAAGLDECRRMGVEILPPDINESFGPFSVVPGKRHIRFGLFSIKNFGEGLGEVIIEERKQGGPYTSLGNFLSRVKDRNLNKKSLEALIKSGALDTFGERGRLLSNIEHLLAYVKEASEESGSLSLFGASGEAPLSLAPTMSPAPERQKLAWEKELLGFYLSGHPLDEHEGKLKTHGTNITDVKKAMEGQTVVAAGLITALKPIITKGKGEKMAFLTLADRTDTLGCVLFPRVYDVVKESIAAERCVALKGKLSTRDGEKNLIVDEVKML